MATRPVKVAFLADTKDLRSSLAKAEQSMEDAANEARTSGDKIDSALSTAADGSDKLASASAQTAGGLGDLGGALGLLPGPLGRLGSGMEAAAPAIMGVTGAADLLNVATEKFPFLSKAAAAATKAQAAVTRGLGIAVRFAMGPVGLILIGLTLLAAGLVLAYKKSDTFRAIVDKAFSLVKKAGAALFNGLKIYFQGITKAMGAVISFSGTLVSKVRGGFDNVVDFIRGVPGKIRDLGGKFKDAGASIMNKIVDGIRTAAGFIGNVASGIWNAVKGMINQAIDKINAALEFRISLPLGKSVTINPPNIPHLAKGGIVLGPTLALIGEAGPEAVVPLDGRGVGGTVNIFMNGTFVGSSKTEVGRWLADALGSYRQAGGKI